MGLWNKFQIKRKYNKKKNAEKTRQSKFSKQFENEKECFLPTHMRMIKNKHKKKIIKKKKSLNKNCF